MSKPPKHSNEKFQQPDGTFKFPDGPFGVSLIQSMPVEEVLKDPHSLQGGGFGKVTTIQEVRAIALAAIGKLVSGLKRWAGVGATAGLGTEITHKGGKAHEIIKKSETEVEPKELDLTKSVDLSFTQIAAMDPDCTVLFNLPNAKDRNDLLKQIIEKVDGRKESAVVTIKATAGWIKTRAVDNPKDCIAKPLTEAVKGQAVAEFKDIVVSGAGVITGDEMQENVILKGLHFHTKKEGHVLDLKDLSNIRVYYTPVKETLIRKGDGTFREAKTTWQEKVATSYGGSKDDLTNAVATCGFAGLCVGPKGHKEHDGVQLVNSTASIGR